VWAGLRDAPVVCECGEAEAVDIKRLSHLIHGAAIDAILDGTEKITRSFAMCGVVALSVTVTALSQRRQEEVTDFSASKTCCGTDLSTCCLPNMELPVGMTQPTAKQVA
jgi:hypothetical protein